MSKNRQLTKPLTTEDNFDQWINEQVQHWRNMTNENVTFDKSSLCAQLFRSAVKEVLPISVQGKLRDIPGLDEMDHNQWSETVRHFVKTHQEAELALEKQSREVTRKLAQANLEQLKKDKKLKGTYVVRGEAGGSEESTGEKRAGSESRTDIKARGQPKSAKPPTYSCKCAATTGVPSSVSGKQ